MTMRRLGLSLTQSTINEIDQLRGDVARERWMRRAVEDRVKNERKPVDPLAESSKMLVEIDDPSPSRRRSAVAYPDAPLEDEPADPPDSPLVIKKPSMETHLFAGSSATRCARCGRGRDAHHKKLTDISHNTDT